MRGSSLLVSHILHLGAVSPGCAPVRVRVLFRTSEMRTAGCGESGQLGHGSRNNEALPRRVEALPPSRASSRARNHSQCHVIDVSCGAHHSAAVTVAGHAYTWGQGSAGQLGHGDASNLLTPVASARLSRSLALHSTIVEVFETCASQVLVCGTHKKRDSRLHATQVSCGGSMTMAIGDDKKVMCWGVIDRGPFASSET